MSENGNMIDGMIAINKNSPLPLYYQLKKDIMRLIDEGKLKRGDKIPSERKLCAYHNVSRMTVNKAIEKLVQEGYLYREQGKGTFVAEQEQAYVISPLASFTAEMEKRGFTPLTRLKKWKIIKAGDKLADKLRIKTEDKLYRLERVRFVEDTPFLWEKVHLPVKFCPDLERNELDNISLYRVLEEKYHYNLSYAEATVEPVLLNNQVASELETDENTLGLLFYQLTYLEEGRPIEWTEAYYRNDDHKFRLQFGEHMG